MLLPLDLPISAVLERDKAPLLQSVEAPGVDLAASMRDSKVKFFINLVRSS